MPGIWTSSRIAANDCFITARSAASPEPASIVRWPSCSRIEMIDEPLGRVVVDDQDHRFCCERRHQSALLRAAGPGSRNRSSTASSSAVSTGLGM